MTEISYRKPDVLQKKHAKYFHLIETASQADILKLQNQKLVAQMAYLKQRSVFYQQKFSAAGIDFDSIKTVADLGCVPFTLKQELRDSLAAQKPFGLHQAADWSDIVQMQASSGTTGSPAYVALTQSDAEMWHELSARGLFAGGVRPGDLVLHGFSMSKGFVGGIPCFQAAQYMGCIDIPIGADGGVDRLMRACADLRPQVVLGAPYFLLHLAERAQELCGKPASALGVQRLIVGGEPGGGVPAVREALEKSWNAKVCELMGGTDLGVIYWAECDHQAGMHMICQDYIIVELINPETCEVLEWKKGMTGELVYTAIGRQASPLLRFRSGDHIVITDTQCECGRTGPMIRCFGRTDDMLIVRGVNVFPSAILDIVMSMQPQTNGVMRVLADFAGHTTQENLKVLVERGAGCNPAQDVELKKELETRLRNALAFKPEIQIIPADSFDKPGVQKIALVLRKAPEFFK